MSLSEFDIIEQIFNKNKTKNPAVVTGIGDDAAIIEVPPNQRLAVSTDCLVSGVHFPVETKPYDIGFKSLSVSLSDMAAMGASPLCATLSLTLEKSNTAWLEQFSSGFFDIASRFDLELAGGDITHGPLSITVQIMGLVPPGEELLRSGANPGDDIYVTGRLGMAAYALYRLSKPDKNGDEIPAECLQRLNRPEPRVEIGIALRRNATACIDISDGLKADLDHLLTASSTGAEISMEGIPFYNDLIDLDLQARHALGLASGDDYELCFTLKPGMEDFVSGLEITTSTSITKIGKITASPGLIWKDDRGHEVIISASGYRHF